MVKNVICYLDRLFLPITLEIDEQINHFNSSEVMKISTYNNVFFVVFFVFFQSKIYSKRVILVIVFRPKKSLFFTYGTV